MSINRNKMNLASYDIIGIGVSTVDLLTVVDQFPAHEGVQKAHESSLQGGGPIATALVAASRLGAKTAMIDAIGDDWRGDLIVKEFERFGVDTHFITVSKDKTSSISSILVRKSDGKRAIVFSPGSSGELPVSALPLELIAQSKIIHINGRHFNDCKTACKIAKEKGVKIAFDGGAGRYRNELDEILPLVDYCIIAKDFCDSWLGPISLNEALHKIIDNGSSVAVITLGEHGCVAANQSGEEIHQKAYVMDGIIDTTGCGDIFHGAFLYAMAKDITLKRALMIASAAAALKARHLGGRGMVPTIDQIMALIGHD